MEQGSSILFVVNRQPQDADDGGPEARVLHPDVAGQGQGGGSGESD